MADDQQEYKWEMEVYMEIYALCFTPCGMCYDLDLNQNKAKVLLTTADNSCKI